MEEKERFGEETMKELEMLDVLFAKVVTIELDEPKIYAIPDKILLLTKEKTKELLQLIAKKRLHQGHNPLSIVGATIYLAGLKTCLDYERHSKTRFFSMRRIRYALGITEVTVRNNVRHLAVGLNLPVTKLLKERTIKWHLGHGTNKMLKELAVERRNKLELVKKI